MLLWLIQKLIETFDEGGLSIGSYLSQFLCNLYLSQFFQPALSTVDVPRFKLGQRSMEVLDLMINKKSFDYSKETELPIRLVFRGSTK